VIQEDFTTTTCKASPWRWERVVTPWHDRALTVVDGRGRTIVARIMIKDDRGVDRALYDEASALGKDDRAAAEAARRGYRKPFSGGLTRAEVAALLAYAIGPIVVLYGLLQVGVAVPLQGWKGGVLWGVMVFYVYGRVRGGESARERAGDPEVTAGRRVLRQLRVPALGA
jgi:hypothetical protein